MAERLEFIAGFKDNISAGAKKAGKALEAIRPSHGMEAANKWMETFRKGTDKTVSTLRPVTSMMNSVGVGGLAASLSIGELVKQFKDLGDSTLTLKELSRQSRISEDDLRRLRYAGERFHLNPEAVSGAVNAWSAQMVGFRMHTSKFYNELALMNADVAKRIASQSPIDGLKTTLDYIARIKDPQIRKMWADDAGLGDMLPMLSRGSDGLASIFADAAREVKPMSQEMKDVAERFNTSVTNLRQTWDNIENDLGPAVLDPLTAAIGKLDEAVKLAAASPGDTAAGAAIIAGSFAAFWARARIMRGSMLAGGAGSPARIAAQSEAAANVQKGAATSFAEAVAEFRAGVAEMRGVGGGSSGTSGGAGAPAEEKPGKPGQRVKPRTSLFENALNAWQLYELAKIAKEENALSPPTSFSVRGGLNFLDPNLGNLVLGPGRDDLRDSRVKDDAYAAPEPRTATLSPESYWARKRAYLGLPVTSASDRWTAPSRYNAEARARHDGLPLSTLPALDLFKTVKEGSKEGIVAGLKEMAQQAELGGPGSGVGVGAGDRGHGLPSLRYGRNPASGAYRRTLGQKYDLSEGGLGSKIPIMGSAFRTKAPGIAGRLKQDFPGLTDEDAAAILGNLGHESGGFTQFEEDHGRGPGRGWAQWTDPGRKARFFQFAKDHNLDPRSDDANYGFLRWELQHTHKSAISALRRAYNLRDKTRVFEGIFEGAGVKNWGSRDRYADGALSAIQDAAPRRHAAGGSIRGPGGPRSDSIPAWLSNGEFVVNARASGQWLPFLHAINSGHMFADGGSVGFGVDKRFYPRSTPGISAAEGAANRRSWRDFFRRPGSAGGMGASWRNTFGAIAMMNGETGWGLNSNTYGWDVNGPSGGAAQWHDVTVGKWAGKIHRLSDLMAFAMQQHADWHDPKVQQAFWKKEATGSLAGAWRLMRLAKTAAGTLKQGVDHFEIPADKLGELHKRLPNIARLQREALADGAAKRGEMDPLEVNIRHHPRTGRPIIQARSGRGVKLGIRTMPTMRPT